VRHRRMALAGFPAALMALGLAGTTGPAADGIEFLDPLTNEPLEIQQRPGEHVTPAVERFHATGENPYAGDQEAIAEGKKIYAKWCRSCHLDDGSGRIGPNLNDNQWNHRRTGTDQGKFEIIYAGGAGAMQAFGDRLNHDEILKLIAFVDTLQKE
jgi:cytochrome c-L